MRLVVDGVSPVSRQALLKITCIARGDVVTVSQQLLLCGRLSERHWCGVDCESRVWLPGLGPTMWAQSPTRTFACAVSVDNVFVFAIVRESWCVHRAVVIVSCLVPGSKVRERRLGGLRPAMQRCALPMLRVDCNEPDGLPRCASVRDSPKIGK